MLEINNVPIPTPSSFKVGFQDISDAERDANGEMHIDRIATKIKLELQWKSLEPVELAKVLQLIRRNTTFFVKYPDPETARMETKTFYCGDRSVPMYSYVNGKPTWNDIAFNLIEK